MGVSEGDIIEVRYKGWKKSNNEVFETNEDTKTPPLTMKVGSKDFIKGLSKGVLGMNEGETKTIDIPCDEAYGKRRHELLQQLSKSQLGSIIPKVGKVLMLKHQFGGMFPAMITDVREDHVILDMNPPLAGEDLVFKVKLERIVKKSN